MTHLQLYSRLADLQSAYNVLQWMLRNLKADAATRKRWESQLAQVRVDLTLAQSRYDYSDLFDL